jgi:hypothetical protein
VKVNAILNSLAALARSSAELGADSMGTAPPNQGKLTDGGHDLDVALHRATIKGHGSISFREPTPTGNSFYRLHKP